MTYIAKALPLYQNGKQCPTALFDVWVDVLSSNEIRYYMCDFQLHYDYLSVEPALCLTEGDSEGKKLTLEYTKGWLEPLFDSGDGRLCFNKTTKAHELGFYMHNISDLK